MNVALKMTVLLILCGSMGCAAVSGVIMTVGFAAQSVVNCTTRPFQNDVTLNLKIRSEADQAEFYIDNKKIGKGNLTIVYNCNYSDNDSKRLIAADSDSIVDDGCLDAIITKEPYSSSMVNLPGITARWPDGSFEIQYPQISLAGQYGRNGLCGTNFEESLFYFKSKAVSTARVIASDVSREKTDK